MVKETVKRKFKYIMTISILLLTLFQVNIYASEYTVTYDANGGTFEGGTTNITQYTIVEEDVTKISKTKNISDDGTDDVQLEWLCHCGKGSQHINCLLLQL